ncbi:Ionotropic receptor 116 [Diabrotica virgifera virgifera]|nr:Ionotropic receptor 116 [Diabrotica virgifera virgifera]
MLVMMIIKLFLLASAKTMLLIDPLRDFSSEQSLNSCAAELCGTYLNDSFHRSVIVIFENSAKFSTSRSYLVTELSNENKPYYIISLTKPILNFRNISRRIFQHVLIEMSSVNSFKEIIERSKLLPTWNPKANFLIVSFTAFENSKVIANKVFTLLWKEDIVPIAVLLLDQNNTKDFNIFTKSFFYDLNVDVPTTTLCGRLAKGTVLSKNKLKKNTFRTVRAKLYPFPPFVIYDDNLNVKISGIEIKLLEILSQALKLTIEYSLSDPSCPKGEAYNNGTITREFKELFDKKYDLIFGGYATSYGRILYFDLSFSYYYDELMWCAPSRKFYGHKLKIQRVVILLGLLLLVVLLGLIWHASINKQRLKFGTSIEDIVLKSYAICLYIAITRLPKTDRLRYLVGILIIFAFFCNTMFTTTITSLFIGRKPSQKYDSMPKLYKNNLTTYFITNSFRYFTSEFIQGIPRDEIERRKTDCKDTLECLKRVVEGDSALLTTKSNTDYLLNMRKIDKESLNCFHYSYGRSMSIIMRKGFMYTDDFDRIIRLLVSTGVVQKWRRDIFWDYQDKTKLNFKELELKEFLLVFYILIFGCSCSILVFFCELCTN